MENETRKIDLLAIGDITTDAFIRLKDAKVHCNFKNEDCELCVRFGDKIPYESVTVLPAVGNSPNASVCASRLGLRTALVTNLGNDLNGKNCLQKLIDEKVDTNFVKIEEGKKTNYHYVLWYENERTILVKHENYERELPNVPEKETPKWIYLSSMGENSLEFHKKIADYLEKHKEVKLAFQPGTFQIKFGKENLSYIYARTDAFFANKEEAEKILGLSEKSILEISEGIASLGPKIVFISDGEKGAYLYEDGNLWYLPIYPNKNPPLERTGAGDAFSASIVAGMILGLPPNEAFLWGQVNSMSVIQYIGAQEGLLSREKLEVYLKNAPADYKLTKMN